MEVRGEKNSCIRVWMFCFTILSFLFIQCDGRRTMLIDSYEAQPYGSSPLTLPPFDSLAPVSLSDGSPPFYVYPPPQSSSTPVLPPSSSPIEPVLSPPFGPIGTTPPSSSSTPSPFGLSPTPLLPPSSSPIEPILSPPIGPIATTPPSPSSTPSPIGLSPTPFSPPFLSPIEPILSPPSGPIQTTPSPPYYEPSPPSGIYNPSPPEYIHGPPVFQPPVVFPGLSPPPMSSGGERVWCVAKPSVPDPILIEAMNYACGSGADCDAIQPNGQCFQPNSALAHSSYAFNSYWQRTKVAGGTCEFGGIAMLVTVNPGSQGCQFV